jgi:ASCH domain
MTSLFALTVRQPFAWAIAEGEKTVENRTWRTSMESGGLFAVHSAMKAGDPYQVPAFLRARDASPSAALGAVVAVVRLEGIHKALDDPGCTEGRPCSPWAIMKPGMRHWVLAGPCPLAEPVPCGGKLGLWRLPEDVEAAVRAQLEAGS